MHILARGVRGERGRERESTVGLGERSICAAGKIYAAPTKVHNVKTPPLPFPLSPKPLSAPHSLSVSYVIHKVGGDVTKKKIAGRFTKIAEVARTVAMIFFGKFGLRCVHYSWGLYGASAAPAAATTAATPSANQSAICNFMESASAWNQRLSFIFVVYYE